MLRKVIILAMMVSALNILGVSVAQAEIQPKFKEMSVYFNGTGSVVEAVNINGSNYININELSKFGFGVNWSMVKDSPDNKSVTQVSTTSSRVVFSIRSLDFGDEVTETTYKANKKLVEILYPNSDVLEEQGDVLRVRLGEPIKYFLDNDKLYVCLRDVANSFGCKTDFYKAEKKKSGIIVEYEELVMVNRLLWKSNSGEFVLN